MKTFFFLFVLFIFAIFAACKKLPEKVNNEDVNSHSEDTVSLTPAQNFAIILVEDFINEDDPDFEAFLENIIYPIVAKADKVTIDKLSDTIYLLTYFLEGTEKNILIEKYFSPSKEETFFEYKEVKYSRLTLFLNR
ncbi:MAG: hypothetical protein ACP5P3_08860 [Ignavibacteria bacterium]